MQGGLVTIKLFVCPSVRQYVKYVIYDKTKETCAHILIQHERSFIIILWQEEWLVGGDSFYLKFWIKLIQWSENVDFLLIFNGRFCVKSHFAWRKSLCENCRWQSCKAFNGLSIPVEMIGRGCPVLYENLA